MAQIILKPERRKALGAMLHEKGYNCCQSALMACGDLTGLPEKSAAAIGYGFGGGMQCGEVCGALSGALMAIGAACLPGDAPKETRPLAKELTVEMVEAFRAEFDTLLCRDIVEKHEKTLCGHCIAFAAEQAAQIILAQRQKQD